MHEKPARKHWLRRYDWDALAGILAAATALILHFLHVVQSDVLLTLTLVLVALLLLRQLRHEEREERLDVTAGRTEQLVERLHERVPLDVQAAGTLRRPASAGC